MILSTSSLALEMPWYALYVKTHHEKLVATSLRNKGYSHFLPLYLARYRSTGVSRDVLLPLFPNYVFCRFRADKCLPIVTTPGVFQIVGAAGVPAPIDDAEISSIEKVVGSGLSAQPWPFLRRGDRVLIEEGPLQGAEGVLCSAKGATRLVVTLTLLQRSVAVEIDRGWVRPLRR